MASTFTTNLGVEKPAKGDYANNWQAPANTNYDILDRAISKSASVVLASAGTSGSPNTLVVSDGALSDGQCAYIEYSDSGDLGADAYVRLDPSDSERIVWIKNNLGGNRSLIFFQGDYNVARSYSLANGDIVLLNFRGTGTTSLVQSMLSNIEIDSLTATTISASGNVTGANLAISNWNTAFNDKVNSMAFDTANGNLTITQQDAGTVVANLDGRYSTTNTTYSAGNGITLTGTTFSVVAGNGLTQDAGGLSMSGSYTGTLTATAFSGSGASLTTLNASNISSGTLSANRLPSTISADTSGNAATATLASTATVTTVNTASNFPVMFHSGTTLNSTAAVYCNPSTNILFASDFTVPSDRRLKNNITTLDGKKAYSMRGVSYTRDGQSSSGVIAQELETVAPELIKTTVVDGEEYLGVSYSKLVGYLIEAVKDLNARLEALEK